MRDILVTLIVFGGIPFILHKPYIGILMWSWLGYMNPHRLTWDFAYSMPFAQIVAIATLVSMIFSREPKRFPITGLTVVWLLFILWMTITTLFAIYLESAYVQLIKVFKIQLVTLFTLLLIDSKERLNMLIWVIVLSIGFFGFKGGLFTILTGGNHRVWGPPASFIGGNNSLALALLMLLPLLYYLRFVHKNKWVRWGLIIGMLLTAVSIVGSHSRGAYLAGGTVAIYFWLKSNHKLLIGIGIVLLIMGLLAFMPQSWHDRMATIQTYEQDASAIGRIEAWNMTINLASDRLTGGGFDIWTQEMFNIYGEGHKARAAHSIYFSILGEHGWIGLILFLIIGIMSLQTGRWVIRHCRGHEELTDISTLVRMVQVSLIAYASGGAFLSLAYFDLYWHLMIIMVITKEMVKRHLAEFGQKAAAQQPIGRLKISHT